MCVGINHGGYRKTLADVLLEQLPRSPSHFPRHQRVEDDPPGPDAYERYVGKIESADLIDAGDHLVETGVGRKSGLTKQGGVNAVEVRLPVKELEPFHVPGNVAGVSPDREIRHGSN